MFLILPPAPKLATLVHAYWFIEDLPGEYAGHLTRTSPIPLAVLSVNMGRPNAAEDGGLVPSVSFLGLQSRSRAWRSWSETYFVMVMLTIPGLVRLFPHTGSGTADMLLDLAALTGDAPAQTLKNGVGLEQEPRRIAALLDHWLISRMSNTRPISEGKQIAIAHSILKGGGTVETAAETAQVSRRQLHRLFLRHLGKGPKSLADLERLHSSLKSVQSDSGEPVLGFSDQAHQIRSWQRRLGVTPGAYAREARTPLADQLGAQGGSSGIAYYL
ncbi:Helix-turn-helix domain-containing protein [Rhizobium sp. NFR07]|uniref:helix-turn-helix domain-containing protein n=1 Tax=Rhizobium sp. NFR07 TaxID=1566262 RepID=UPI0008F3627F|nr:helix-turn-helix domain-containing protein [Rhizobium sp. NFR07]SFB57186.1 Helix-turn-helix domain-containing protein [Rhizobium sp. NFR07]